MISRPCMAKSLLKVASRPTLADAALPLEQSGISTRSGRGTVTRSWLPRPKMAAPAATTQHAQRTRGQESAHTRRFESRGGV